jgi:hypothetical protein
MKYFVKCIFALLIDAVIVCVLTFSFIVFAENTSGFLFSNTHFLSEKSVFETLLMWIKPFIIIFVIYLLVSVIFKNSIGGLATKKGKLNKALKLFFAKLIDWTIILLITLIINFLLQKLFYYDFFVLLFAIFLLYSVIYALLKASFGKSFFGIKLTGKSTIIYIAYKLLFIIVLPLFVFRVLGIVDFYALFVNLLVSYLFFVVFSVIILKKTLWEYLSKTNYFTENQKFKFVFCKIICLYLVIAGGFLALKLLNNQNHKNGLFD